jgi:prepilin-type N-terminal cleavage/methylation domain-containing protein
MSPGFSLIELMFVVAIFGLLVALAIPQLARYASSNQLKSAAQSIGGELRLARQKAISTGASQTMHFTINYPAGTTYDYHIHNGPTVGPCWSLPNGITYVGGSVSPTLTSDGRSSASGTIILRNQSGIRDTITVERSGLILVQ